MARIKGYATFQVNWCSWDHMKMLHNIFEVKLTPLGHLKGYFEYFLKMAHNLYQNDLKYREIYI